VSAQSRTPAIVGRVVRGASRFAPLGIALMERNQYASTVLWLLSIVLVEALTLASANGQYLHIARKSLNALA